MSAQPPEDELGPAEQRLQTILVPLQGEPAATDPAAVGSVMRAVRWQRSLREVLDVLGGIAHAVAEGISTIVGSRRRGE
ncbi:MAG: hypothetical protein H0T39_07840 [Actinobacteria bacterium]|nr:hypothetical protein [Actinomycetota bacterium]